MAIPLPKRVKDLPPLESDSEDEIKTPAKFKQNHNEDENKKFDFYGRPKRVSELSPLTDSDDESRMSRFNQAILDGSLVLSPLNSPEHCSDHKFDDDENNKNHLNISKNIAKNVNSIELPDLAKLTLNEEPNKSFFDDIKPLQKNFIPTLTTEKSTNDNNSLLSRFSVLNQIKPRSLYTTSSTNEDIQISKDHISHSSSSVSVKSQPEPQTTLTRANCMPVKECPVNTKTVFQSKSETSNNNNNNQRQSNLKLDYVSSSSTRKKSAEISDENNQVTNNKNDDKENILSKLPPVDTETPFKTAVSNVVTPLFKSSQINTNNKQCKLTSTHKKLKNVNKDEFQSSKVLFRTPYAVARPIQITPLPNDSSISLSFDNDSIQSELIDEKSTKKLSPIKENKNSRKSSKNLFGKEMEKLQILNSANDDDSVLSDNDSDKNVILINGKKYILYDKLGAGGSSSVYLAKNKITKTMCAIKIVDLKGDKMIVEGYLNETRLLAKLQGNVNIVALYEYEHITEKSTLYMVMEKGDSDLHKILQTYETDIPLYVLVNFWYQILQAVNYIHENGVIHSDLKPSNFLMINGRLKLIDFGIASNISVDSTSIIKYSQAGTFNYISPEALIDTSNDNSPMNKGQPRIRISTKSDVWSLGCILYLLLYKKTPFGHIMNIYAKVSAITNSNTKIDYPEIAPYYPRILIDMAQKCLKYNPKERVSVAELLKYPFDKLIPLNNLDSSGRKFD